jgi:hypothetical protein
MKKILIILSVITLIGCSPKVTTSSLNSNLPSRIGMSDEPFAILEQDTIDREMHKMIGQVAIKDSGFSKNCAYGTVLEIAKQEALKLGGNCLVITKHKAPDASSTCHRIDADVFLVDNPKDFENEILWSENRKLEISDFKGATENKPDMAYTVSGFGHKVFGKRSSPNKYKVVVVTYFNCKDSYFKRSNSDSLLLARQQVHFDITELYARKFLEQVSNESKDLNQFQADQIEMGADLANALLEKREQYNREVQEDSNKFLEWENWVKKELKKYDKYSDKILIVEK